MIDKNFCMSSYLAFRYIERDDMEFAAGLHHTKDIPYPEEKRLLSIQQMILQMHIRKHLNQKKILI